MAPITKRGSSSAGGLPAGVRTWLWKGGVGLVLIAVLLFGSAGTLRWAMGWAVFGVFLIVAVVPVFVVDPDLLAERTRRGKAGQAPWDRPLFAVYGTLSGLVSFVVPGLDRRFGWSAPVAVWLQIAALGVYLAAWALQIWVMRANRFYSDVVRIQEDRGQRVVTAGPYGVLRHPGYLSGIVTELARPVVLGSLWGLVPGGLAALLLAVRTLLEDRTLRAELPGYAEYAGRVRYRLLPGVW